MHLPPLSSPVISGYYSSGDVSIAGDVVMAAGVILRANTGCFIRLEEGVCLGLGVILHACNGNIIVRSGAILGAGVLVVGWATVGQQACLGASVTVFNAAIAAGQLIPPGTLLQDAPAAPQDYSPGFAAPSHDPPTHSVSSAQEPTQNSPQTEARGSPDAAQHPPDPEQEPPNSSRPQVIYGRDQFWQMRVAMFPHSTP